MMNYYLEVLREVSICLDPYIGYYHHFEVGDVIPIHMYSDKGPKVVIDSIEYNCEFTIDWDKTCSARLSVAKCIDGGYLVDITKNVDRNFKLEQLGI